SNARKYSATSRRRVTSFLSSAVVSTAGLNQSRRKTFVRRKASAKNLNAMLQQGRRHQTCCANFRKSTTASASYRVIVFQLYGTGITRPSISLLKPLKDLTTTTAAS